MSLPAMKYHVWDKDQNKLIDNWILTSNGNIYVLSSKGESCTFEDALV